MGLHSFLFRNTGKSKALRETWKDKLRNLTMEIDEKHDLPIPKEHAQLFFDYLSQQEKDFETATALLREEGEAKDFCQQLGLEVSETRTRSKEHHQSSAAVVAAVSGIARDHCSRRGMDLNVAPSRRCVAL